MWNRSISQFFILQEVISWYSYSRKSPLGEFFLNKLGEYPILTANIDLIRKMVQITIK